MELGSNKIGQKRVNTCFFGRDIIKLHTEKYTETNMNVYANRTPTVPDETVKNISSRLVSIINGSDVNEIQGGRLLELCRECWGAGWQHGHFVMNQTGPQEETIDSHLEAVYEEMSSQESYGGTD